MIISEKQIAGLMVHVVEYIHTLKDMRLTGQLTASGESNLDSALMIINQINNQQSKELKEIL